MSDRQPRSAYPRRHAVSVTLRPERAWYQLSWLDRLLRGLYSGWLWPWRRRLLRQSGFARQVIAASEALAELSEEAFLAHRDQVRERLLREGITPRTLVPAFAMVREAAGRSLGMRHHHTQIRASLIMLRGMVAEMATGEGKTLACTLASATAALAGVKVHVVTTNDYLAERDCEETLPLFHYLGLSAASLLADAEVPQRQQIYACDIVYCSNNELVFDYLKDLLVLGDRRDSIDVYRDMVKAARQGPGLKLMQQGLVFAIVDEADSVFIDESRTPLVISGGDVPLADSEEFLRYIMAVAQAMQPEEDYRIDHSGRRILLLQGGRDQLEEALSAEQGLTIDGQPLRWHQKARGEELLLQALSALHLYQRDKHYIVGKEPADDKDAAADAEADDKVMIVDEYTGRLAADRSWEGGLHQMIEVKEGCPLTKPQKTLAKISYQQFFRKYFYLSGMTGTAQEVMDEFYGVYGLLVCKVPLLRASRRRRVGYRVLPTMVAKEQAVVEAVRYRTGLGQSVLVGTATVDQSEGLAASLQRAGIPFELLTAKQDADEAAIVARAGEPGRVTIATSMAGRGTDIKLRPETREAGGLHVIICELQDASRIDRQLEGRCARQGDPGTVEYCLSWEDPLVNVYGRQLLRLALPLLPLPWLGPRLAQAIQRYCQWRLERKHARERRMTQRTDERERKTLAFLGGGRWG